MQASIIIPSKNRQDILLNSLQFTVNAIHNVDVEVIIVNDGEKDIDIPVEWKSRVRVLRNDKSGVASARNIGARHAISDLYIFLDDDILIHENAIQKMIQLSAEYPNDTININWVYTPELLNEILKTKFGRYLHQHGFTTLKGWNHDQPWNDEQLFENIGITSQFLAIHKKTFTKLNGYDESFPHAGFEDYEFAKRLHNSGTCFYIWPKDIVYHNETDRQDLKKWLQRKERGGETRKHGVLRGNTELAIEYKGVKKIILAILVATENLWIAILDLLPNWKILDSIYGKIVSTLLAASIFKGYTKVKS